MPEPGLFITGDGSHSIYSEKFGVPYHSIHGAIQETQHVFIDAGLKHKLNEQKDKIKILEIGLGTGLNAFMTLLYANKHEIKIDYTALEAYPINAEEASQLNFPKLLNTTHASSLNLLHDCKWDQEVQINPHFLFKKIKTKFEDYAYPQVFDLIYFDAFAPNSQPELWNESFLENIYRTLLPKGTLTSYCAKGSFKRALKAVGFQIESIPGPPRKREMTRATKIS